MSRVHPAEEARSMEELVRSPPPAKTKAAKNTDVEDNLHVAVIRMHEKKAARAKAAQAAEEAKGPQKRYNHLGHEIDGKFTKDKVLLLWGGVLFFWLLVSWTMQWAMFALPNWRGDQYQTAGLFQVCGTVDLQFNPTFADAGGAGNLTILATHEYRCQSVETYVNNFLEMVKPDPNRPQPSDRWYKSAVGALPHIQTSRWLEAAGTALDMVFGVGTILLIVRPHPERKVETRNAAITYAGILIMPWFPVFDILISFDFWDRIGVGYFESLTFNSGGFSNYTKAGAVVSLFTSWFDLVVQLWFLTWGLQRMFRANKKRGAVSELGEEKDIPLQQV